MEKAITFNDFLKEYFELLQNQYKKITGNEFVILKEKLTVSTKVSIKDQITKKILVDAIDTDQHKAKHLVFERMQRYINNLSSVKILQPAIAA